MSWYSLQALVIVRSIESFVKDKLTQLINKIDSNQQSTNFQLAEIELEVLEIRKSLESQKTQLDQILDLLHTQSKTFVVEFKFADGTTINSLGGLLMVITDVQSVTATATELDAKGNPVKTDATKLKWASADESKVSVVTNPDGSVKFTAVGPLTAQPDGTDPGVQVSVTDGNLTQVDFIQVVSSEATKLGITFGQPV